MDIRKMEEKDLNQVSWIDQLAFSAHARKTYGVMNLPQRTIEGLKAYLNRTGSEGLVAEQNGQVVGYTFVHQWGSLGWFGPVGVDPNYQGRGLGKKLVEEGMHIFDQRQVQEIGLETMVDSPTNIGLYMSLGFQPLHLAFDLVRPVKSVKELGGQPPRTTRPRVKFIHLSSETPFSENEFHQLVVRARTLTSSIIRGLDYLPELELILQHGFGRVILMEESGELVGLALVMLTDLRGQHGLTVSLRGLVVKPGLVEQKYLRLSELLKEVYRVTREAGSSKIFITVYSDNEALTRYLMKEENFTISFPYLRMVMNDPQFAVPRGGIELSKWRG